MPSLRHSTIASGPNNPDKQVSVTGWNAEHTLTGTANYLLGFDASGNAVDVDPTTVGSTSVAWGSVAGTLSAQTDLQAALDAKANLSGAAFTGTVAAYPNNDGLSLFVFDNGNTQLGVGEGLNGLSFEMSFFSGWNDATTGATDGKFTFNGRNSSSGALANYATINHTGLSVTGTVTASNLSGTNTGDQTITLTGDVTGSGAGSFAATIANSAVTLAKMANMATASLIYRKTAGSGAPEVNTLATLKTDLGLTGTNSGDQTITLTGDVTGSGTGSFAATIVAGAVTYAKLGDVTTTAQVQAGTASKVVASDKLAAASAPQTLTDGATISWDMSAGFNAKVTLGGNRTLTVSNPFAGWTYSLNVIQDGTGSRTMTWPASFDWGTTGAPTLTTTASKRDRITLFCTDAATPKFDAFLSGKGFS